MDNTNIPLLSIRESFDAPLPKGWNSLSDEHISHASASSTTTAQSRLPSRFIETPYHFWDSQATKALSTSINVAQYLRGNGTRVPQLPEWETNRYFVSEGEVVEGTTSQLTNPVDLVFRHWCLGSRSTGQRPFFPCLRAEFTTRDGVSRCDKSWHMTHNTEEAIAVLELKRTHIIMKADFDRLLKNETLGPGNNLQILLKQAVHYAVSYETRFVAIFDWRFLVLVVFRNIDLGRQKELLRENHREKMEEMAKCKAENKKFNNSKYIVQLQGGNECCITFIDRRDQMRRALLGFLVMANDYKYTGTGLDDLTGGQPGGKPGSSGKPGSGASGSGAGGGYGKPGAGSGKPGPNRGWRDDGSKGYGAIYGEYDTRHHGAIPTDAHSFHNGTDRPVDPSQARPLIPAGLSEKELKKIRHQEEKQAKEISKRREKNLGKLEKLNKKRLKKGLPRLYVNENGEYQDFPPGGSQAPQGPSQEPYLHGNQQPPRGRDGREVSPPDHRQRSQSQHRDAFLQPEQRQGPWNRDASRSRSREPSRSRHNPDPYLSQGQGQSQSESVRGRSLSRDRSPFNDRQRSQSRGREQSSSSSYDGRYQTPHDAPPMPRQPVPTPSSLNHTPGSFGSTTSKDSGYASASSSSQPSSRQGRHDKYAMAPDQLYQHQGQQQKFAPQMMDLPYRGRPMEQHRFEEQTKGRHFVR